MLMKLFDNTMENRLTVRVSVFRLLANEQLVVDVETVVADTIAMAEMVIEIVVHHDLVAIIRQDVATTEAAMDEDVIQDPEVQLDEVDVMNHHVQDLDPRETVAIEDHPEIDHHSNNQFL